jgi:hypothetical protein
VVEAPSTAPLATSSADEVVIVVGTANTGRKLLVVLLVLAVVLSMGMTTREALVVVAVVVVVGRGTGVKTSEGTVKAGGGAKVKSGTCWEDGAAVGSSSEEVVDSVGNAVADASGSIVKVMVAVVVERVMVAVRVMRSVNSVEEVVEERIGVLEREVEVDSRSDADREVEVDPRLELDSNPEPDTVVEADVKEEVAEKEDDIALGLGPTTTVVVSTPLVTTTVVVMVLRPLVLADVSRLEDCEEPVLVEDTNPVDVPDEAPPVVAETLPVVDELGNKPSGMAPNTCLAFSTSLHPRIAP